MGKKKTKNLQELIDALQNDKSIFLKYDFGKLSQKEVERIKEETGFDLTGYMRCIDSYGINHAMDKHANQKTEEKRGQPPIEYSDFEQIPEITQQADKIESVGKNRHGRDLLRYSKRIIQKFFYVEEIRTGKKEVVMQTFFKQK